MAPIKGDIVAANNEGVWYANNAVGEVLKICGDTGKAVVKFFNGSKMGAAPQLVTIENFRIVPKG